MTGKVLAAVAGFNALPEAADKMTQAIDIISSLVDRGYGYDDLLGQLAEYYFELSGIYVRMDRFSFEDSNGNGKNYLVDSEEAIREGLSVAKKADRKADSGNREILEGAYGMAGAAYQGVGRVDLAVECYEGALALVRMRKPPLKPSNEGAAADSGGGGGEGQVGASDAHWTEIRLLHQTANAYDSGHHPELGRHHAEDAAAVRVRLFAALKDVGREVEPQCSICLEDLDLENGRDVDVLQCFHCYHKECVRSYLKNASEMGSAALTVNMEQRAMLACPQCKEASGMRVAFGPREGDEEEGGGMSMVIEEHAARH